MSILAFPQCFDTGCEQYSGLNAGIKTTLGMNYKMLVMCCVIHSSKYAGRDNDDGAVNRKQMGCVWLGWFVIEDTVCA